MLARQLAGGPTLAFAAAKRLIRGGWSAVLDDQLAREAQSMSRLGGADDVGAGIAAFTAKLTPRFMGR
jgi:2-(1,2-epoxy-1,2-dihydrophenyl)acetyl-CoA isomerase